MDSINPVDDNDTLTVQEERTEFLSDSGSIVDQNLKDHSRLKFPGTKAFQKIFRSRSSSPRRAKMMQAKTVSPFQPVKKQILKTPLKGMKLSTEERPNADNEMYRRLALAELSQEVLAYRRTIAWLSLNNLHVESNAHKKRMQRLAACHSFSSFERRRADHARRAEQDFRTGEFSISKSLEDDKNLEPFREYPNDIPKVYISLDDDRPRTPEQEQRAASVHSLLDRNTDDSCDSLFTAKSAECLLESSHPIRPKKSSSIDVKSRRRSSVLKSFPIRKLAKFESVPQIVRQQSIDIEPKEEPQKAILSHFGGSISNEKTPVDSTFKVLRKISLSMQGKDKHKVLSEIKVVDDMSKKEIPMRLSENDSSEDSLPSSSDKPPRIGKLREFLSKDSSSSYKKSSFDILDETPESMALVPVRNSKSFGEKVAEYLTRGGSRLQEQQKRLKSQIWSSVVTIVLVKGKNLPTLDEDGLCDPYVKFRLGNEKYKSKNEVRTRTPRWLEQFEFHLFEDQNQILEITVFDKDPRAKDDFLGKCNLDLRSYERETTHQIWVELEGNPEFPVSGTGRLFLLLTISGTTSSASISDLVSYRDNPHEQKAIKERYKLTRTFHNLKDVGHLTVKVYKAQGLAAADFGVGKSDPFCVLELVNSRLQTQTEYKTLCPSWNKIFTFDVKDIHSVLEVTVYDEDRDHKVDFLGRACVPLLRVRNGEKKWYALKDKKLRLRAKGNHPQILLEITVIWNPIRAALHTFDPKEEKYMQMEPKFKRQIFVRNVNRIRSILMDIIDFGMYIKSCFEWESPVRSIVAFASFMLITYYFETYMLIVALLLVFLKSYVVQSIVGTRLPKEEDPDSSGNDDEIDEDDKDKEEKKSLKEKLQAIQEVIATVQNAIGYIASISESVKNTFNFTVPFVSQLMILVLVLAIVVLYMIPVRFLVMLWGVAKFSRKLIRPHSVVNNEILDFFSRVPDNEELKDYRELRLGGMSMDERRRRDGKKKKAS